MIVTSEFTTIYDLLGRLVVLGILGYTLGKALNWMLSKKKVTPTQR